MARSARRIGNQTVLPQFWRKCSPTLQKTNLPQKSRQIMAEGLFVVFSLQDRWRSSQTCFLAQLRSGGLAIKLEGCPNVSQVSNFKKGSFISSVRSSYSHPDLLLIHHHHHPTFSDHTGPQHWTFTF